MDIATIGWVWLGITMGIPLGLIISVFLTQSRINDLESELVHQRFVRDSLKEEIFRLDNQAKPKPRKKRNIKVNKIKVGE